MKGSRVVAVSDIRSLSAPVVLIGAALVLVLLIVPGVAGEVFG